jgi:hypothetical protein
MTSELWDDLTGMNRVAVILANNARKAEQSRFDPDARRKGETKERHASRLQFQQQQAYVRAMRGNPFLIDTDD